jgi:sec-independent protein translocase protein TatB
MFDIGFSELIVIAVVALVVIGPEKLPKVARTIGLLLGRAQRYVNDVKSDINREMQLDELKKLQAQVTDSARAMENSVRQEFDSARSAIESPARAAVDELAATARLTDAPLPQSLEIGPPAPSTAAIEAGSKTLA